MESGPAQINRLNRSRNVTLEVELGKRWAKSTKKRAPCRR
jgi:hypothetical protein